MILTFQRLKSVPSNFVILILFSGSAIRADNVLNKNRLGKDLLKRKKRKIKKEKEKTSL
jgi:hypothetical protein